MSVCAATRRGSMNALFVGDEDPMNTTKLIAIALIVAGILGLVFAALLFGTLQQGGLAVNAFVPKELMDVLTGIVVCAVALADEAIGQGPSGPVIKRARAAKAGAG